MAEKAEPQPPKSQNVRINGAKVDHRMGYTREVTQKLNGKIKIYSESRFSILNHSNRRTFRSVFSLTGI